MIEALEIDPHDSDHWLYGTGLTLYGGRDLTNWDDPAIRNVSIASMAVGIEEMAVLGLASAPGGSELLAAVGDNNGFTYKSASDLGTSPQAPWMDPIWTSATDVDYAGNKVSNVVRVGNSAGSPMVAISSDGGATWSTHAGAGNTLHSGSVAISADADTIVWATGNEGVQRSVNQAAFAPVASLPSSGISWVTSDKRNNKIFYAGSGSNGKLYKSTDGGATFSEISLGSSSVAAIRDIVAHPTKAGEVWVSTNVGLFKSTNSGSSFTKVNGIDNTEQISFGLGSGNNWNVYAFGFGAAGPKLYATANAGANWTDVQGSQGWGSMSANRVVGSANVPGQIYVGTNGRGVYFGKGQVGALRWEQCGGINWKGASHCVAPYTCQKQNDYYYQCL